MAREGLCHGLNDFKPHLSFSFIITRRYLLFSSPRSPLPDTADNRSLIISGKTSAMYIRSS